MLYAGAGFGRFGPLLERYESAARIRYAAIDIEISGPCRAAHGQPQVISSCWTRTRLHDY